MKIPFYFQYSINPYGRELEPNWPHREEIVRSFRQNMPKNAYIIADRTQQLSLGRKLVAIARKSQLKLSACAEPDYLEAIGIRQAKCIDPDRVERICGRPFIGCRQDPAKRNVRGTLIQCGCAPCVEIGENHTCLHGCKYCYATLNEKTARNNHFRHNPDSPLLTGAMEDLTENDKITDRKMVGVLKKE